MAADNPDAVIDIVMRAARVRRAVEADLRPHGISFALWWVLYVTDWLSRQAQDAVSQQEIVLATELDKSTVSYLMRVLSDRGLVDRGPDGRSWAWRIWPTDKGTRLLAASSIALGAGLARATPWNPSAALEHCLAKSKIDV
ncbi:MAG: MarR family transcriptional regulator [Polyangiaceae bacterium]